MKCELMFLSLLNSVVFLFFYFKHAVLFCRDLKPENILLDDNGEFWNFISSDFWILHCRAFRCWYTISDYISALQSTELWVNEMHHAVILQDTSVFLTWGWPSKCLKESSSEAEWGLWATWVRKNCDQHWVNSLVNNWQLLMKTGFPFSSGGDKQREVRHESWLVGAGLPRLRDDRRTIALPRPQRASEAGGGGEEGAGGGGGVQRQVYRGHQGHL